MLYVVNPRGFTHRAYDRIQGLVLALQSLVLPSNNASLVVPHRSRRCPCAPHFPETLPIPKTSDVPPIAETPPVPHPQASPTYYSRAAKTRRCCLIGFVVHLLPDLFPIHKVVAHDTIPEASLDFYCRLLDRPFLELPERGRTEYVSCSNLEGADGRGISGG